MALLGFGASQVLLLAARGKASSFSIALSRFPHSLSEEKK
jgi:hypothetical protein